MSPWQLCYGISRTYSAKSRCGLADVDMKQPVVFAVKL